MENNNLSNKMPIANKTQLEILKRHMKTVDPRFKNIIFSNGKTILYLFDKEWKEMEIEGSLYLYEKEECDSGLYRLIVFNRNNASDFKLNIPDEFYVEFQENFVIFSYLEKDNIFGFWIENKEEAKEFYEILKSLLKTV